VLSQALLRRIGSGSKGSGDGELKWSLGLCFMSDGRHIAVGDNGNHRVSVFSVDGDFVRHVGVDVLMCPMGVVLQPAVDPWSSFSLGLGLGPVVLA
jgi:hypothetical protein